MSTHWRGSSSWREEAGRMPESQRWGMRLVLAMLLLSCAILLGGAQGGQGRLGELACQLLALLAMVIVVVVPGGRDVPPLMKAAILLVLLLPLLQWLPWPAAWSPGTERAALAALLADAGVDPAGRVALAPVALERSLLGLVPALAMAWIASGLAPAEQRRLLGCLLVLVLLSLSWGLVQKAQGPFSPLRLYRHTNLTDATGFFANRNHLAALLLMVLPLSIAAAVRSVTRRLAGQAVGPGRIALAVALAVLLILGIAVTRSRSGMLLCLLALVLSLPMVLAMRRQRGRRRVLLAVSGLGLLLVLQFAFTGILQRLHRNPFEDARWGIAANTLEAARAHAPLGSGLGSFREAYAPFEQAPGPMITHHAHNDWLELWLEGGVPFLLVGLVFAGGFLWCGWRALRARGDESLLLRTRAAWIGLLLVLLQAGVDYAMRTPAIMVASALLLAVLLSGLRELGTKADRVAPRVEGAPG